MADKKAEDLPKEDFVRFGDVVDEDVEPIDPDEMDDDLKFGHEPD